jgi:phosphatidylinositol-3-phosphatase
MTRIFLALMLVMTLSNVTACAREGDVPQSQFGALDHVFLIIMENQTDTDILLNLNAPFINTYAHVANQATNYFAVGHPSLPNYLEIVGGSNFGVSNDYWPNWVDKGCIDNAPRSKGCNHAVTPIAVEGLDNSIVATVTNSTQCNGQINSSGSPIHNNCALYDYHATLYTPKSIADQLVAKHMTWKTYQESLPMVETGLSGVNYSDGVFSNLSPITVFRPGPIQMLYAVKHNPFAYFQNIEKGNKEALSLHQVEDFDGPNGLWADLRSNVPNLAVIVPNQCHDMHGNVKGGTPICTGGDGQMSPEAGFLMLQGDAEVAKLVNGIKASQSWRHGRNAIVLVWDENDFTNQANKVVMLVETNYASNGHVSDQPYDHFSLLRTLEAGFGLPCLNHACDATSKVMNDIFGAKPISDTSKKPL